MFRKKYFFFDIDGTIAVNFPRVIPESTRRTINALIERGHFVSLATGRMRAMTKEFVDEFGITNMVTDGGKGIVLDGKFEVEPLEYFPIKQLTMELDEKNIPWAVCLSDELVCYSKYPNFQALMESSIKVKGYIDFVAMPELDINIEKNIYKGFVYLRKEQEKDIESLKYVSYTRYQENYIILEDDDKSIGIKKIRDRMNIDDRDIVVFGDNTNDIKMFKPEWTSIAMGNAVDELKKVATFVTKDADDDGIEFACKHFGWID